MQSIESGVEPVPGGEPHRGRFITAPVCPSDYSTQAEHTAGDHRSDLHLVGR
jgi:hypothetical protein